MHLVDLAYLSFRDHKKFFKIVDSEPPSSILAYMGLLFIWYAVFSAPYFILQRYVFGATSIPFTKYLSLLPVSFAISFVFWIVWLFVWSAIIHAFISIWGGKSNYLSTFKCITYGLTPLFILVPVVYYALFLGSWFSLVVIAAYLYTTYVIIKGLAQVHKVKMIVAISAYLIPLITLTAWVVYGLWNHGLLGV